MRLSLFGQPDSTPDPLGVPGTERLLTLTDGVVAIALTLLVLQFKVPSLAPGADPNSPHALYVALHLSGSLVSYVVAFYVIGQFWLAHHRVFRYISGHRESLAWWNFGFLFTITLFPFTSALLGSYSNNALGGRRLLGELTAGQYLHHTGARGGEAHAHAGAPGLAGCPPRHPAPGPYLRSGHCRVHRGGLLLTAGRAFVWILLIVSTRLARVWSNGSPVTSDGDGQGEAMAGGAGSPDEVVT